MIEITLLPLATASTVSHRPSLPAVTVAIAPLAPFWSRTELPAWDLPLIVTWGFVTCALSLGEMTVTLGFEVSSTTVVTSDRLALAAGPHDRGLEVVAAVGELDAGDDLDGRGADRLLGHELRLGVGQGHVEADAVAVEPGDGGRHVDRQVDGVAVGERVCPGASIVGASPTSGSSLGVGLPATSDDLGDEPAHAPRDAGHERPDRAAADPQDRPAQRHDRHGEEGLHDAREAAAALDAPVAGEPVGEGLTGLVLRTVAGRPVEGGRGRTCEGRLPRRESIGSRLSHEVEPRPGPVIRCACGEPQSPGPPKRGSIGTARPQARASDTR